jgi:hypothetical protein
MAVLIRHAHRLLRVPLDICGDPSLAANPTSSQRDDATAGLTIRCTTGLTQAGGSCRCMVLPRLCCSPEPISLYCRTADTDVRLRAMNLRFSSRSARQTFPNSSLRVCRYQTGTLYPSHLASGCVGLVLRTSTEMVQCLHLSKGFSGQLAPPYLRATCAILAASAHWA